MRKFMTAQISWLGTPEARILSIRKFRQYIDKLPFDQAISETSQNWKSGPKVIKPKFDISKVNEWPTPWDLFSQSTFCANSQAVGTFYTLILSEHAKDHDIKMAIIEDIINGEKPALIFDNFSLTGLDISLIINKKDITNKLGA